MLNINTCVLTLFALKTKLFKHKSVDVVHHNASARSDFDAIFHQEPGASTAGALSRKVHVSNAKHANANVPAKKKDAKAAEPKALTKPRRLSRIDSLARVVPKPATKPLLAVQGNTNNMRSNAIALLSKVELENPKSRAFLVVLCRVKIKH